MARVALNTQETLEAGMSLELILRTSLGATVTQKNQLPEYILIWNNEKIHFYGPGRSAAGLPYEERLRRKALVERILRMREELPPLGMTTAELVHLAREERKWLYES